MAVVFVLEIVAIVKDFNGFACYVANVRPVFLR